MPSRERHEVRSLARAYRKASILLGLFARYEVRPPAQAYCKVNILFMFRARVTRFHSPVTLSRPRSENWRKPMADLMMPNTGSGVCLRRA